MSWFSASNESAERQELRAMFETTISTLRQAKDWQRSVVGDSVNMMRKTFHGTFPKIEHFRAVSPQTRTDYIDSVDTQAMELRQLDVHTGLGVLLFGFWLKALAMQDVELEDAIATSLEELGRFAFEHPFDPAAE